MNDDAYVPYILGSFAASLRNIRNLALSALRGARSISLIQYDLRDGIFCVNFPKEHGYPTLFLAALPQQGCHPMRPLWRLI